MNIQNEINIKRYILLFIVNFYLSFTCLGQQINVTAPSKVSVGENFRIAYTIKNQEIDDFRSNLRSSDEVEIIAGPYTSKMSSFNVVNGHTTSTSSITYTYTLTANKAGTYSVPAAYAKINGKGISSHALKIVITGQVSNKNNSNNTTANSSTKISGNELFIKVTANKKKVHEQEPILLTYKVYTTLELTQLEGKMPDLTGFHCQEVKLPQQKSFHIERVNGRAYRCVTWSQYVMYPQMTGKLKIPSITFHGIIVQENRSVDPFEAFFNGGSGYVEVKRDIVAPGLMVEVEPLKNKPANFSGGLGKLNITAQLDNKSVKSGTPINLRVVIGGYGNLKLVKQPGVEFPKDFDQYDAKVTDNTKLTSKGLEGNMVYDFLAVPRNQGNYTIPPIKLVYYDVESNQYRTVATSELKLQVTKGDQAHGSLASFSEEKDLDIHNIKEGSFTLKQSSPFFFESKFYWVCLIGTLLIFFLLLIVFRKRAISNSDIVKVKGKKANRIATKRLRKANQLMLHGKSDEFYDEVLKALWGYVGDKLNMPVEKLTEENISQELSSHNITNDIIKKFTNALSECEFERYAPGDPAGNMNKTFESAMTAIIEIERVIKNNKRIHTRSFMLLIALLMTININAINKTDADLAYKKGNYQQAIADYTELIKNNKSSELYYNLGNSYFRTNNVTQAIIAYERALLLNPGDKDIQHNIKFARSKTIDRIIPEDQLFLKNWYDSILFFLDIDTWAIIGLFSIIIALSLILCYLFNSRIRMRQIGFYGAILFLILSGTCMLFAKQQLRMLGNHTRAVIISPAANIKKTPAQTSGDLFVLHEGTCIKITDQSIHGWYGIKLPDGREGWVTSSCLEKI